MLWGGEKLFLKHTFDYLGEDLTMAPKFAEHIQVNGEDCDLRNPEVVKQFAIKVKDYRAMLKAGQLSEYDGKSTEQWQGGRSELLKDEIRIKLALDGHAGKHHLSWKAQELEANRIVKIKAAQARAEGIVK